MSEYRVIRVTDCDKTVHYEIERRWLSLWLFSMWTTVDQDVGIFTTYGPYKFGTKERAEEIITLLKIPVLREDVTNDS